MAKRIFEATVPGDKGIPHVKRISASGAKDWHFFGFVFCDRDGYWDWACVGETEENVRRNLVRQGYGGEGYEIAIVPSRRVK